MFMLNIALVFLGIVFFTFGFLVCFKKKYSLVSFLTRFSASDRCSVNFAEQAGLIGLMGGMLYIFAGIVGFVSSSILVSSLLLVACTCVSLSFFAHSTIKSRKA